MPTKLTIGILASVGLLVAILAPSAFSDGTPSGRLNVHEMGYNGTTIGCIEATATTTGDGGTLAPTANGRYYLTVTDNSAVRISNGVPCVGFTGGTGRIVNGNSLLDWKALPTADGGAPDYKLCAQTAGTVVQMCPQ